MSGYQHREGSGSLFPNKKERDNHPDWKGDAMFNGQIIEIAGWDKTTAGGKRFISVKVQEKRASGGGGSGGYAPEPPQGNRGAAGAPRAPARDELEDSIPF